jgi:hypothetical protein
LVASSKEGTSVGVLPAKMMPSTGTCPTYSLGRCWLGLSLFFFASCCLLLVLPSSSPAERDRRPSISSHEEKRKPGCFSLPRRRALLSARPSFCTAWFAWLLLLLLCRSNMQKTGETKEEAQGKESLLASRRPLASLLFGWLSRTLLASIVPMLSSSLSPL